MTGVVGFTFGGAVSSDVITARGAGAWLVGDSPADVGGHARGDAGGRCPPGSPGSFEPPEVHAPSRSAAATAAAPAARARRPAPRRPRRPDQSPMCWTTTDDRLLLTTRPLLDGRPRIVAHGSDRNRQRQVTNALHVVDARREPKRCPTEHRFLASPTGRRTGRTASATAFILPAAGRVAESEPLRARFHSGITLRAPVDRAARRGVTHLSDRRQMCPRGALCVSSTLCARGPRERPRGEGEATMTVPATSRPPSTAERRTAA